MRNLYPENKFIKAVESGRAPVGFFNYIKDTTIMDIAGSAGFDFVIIDSEHAVMDRETIEHMIIAAQLNEVVPMIRVPEIIPYLMRNYMEMGAQGILVPHVRSGAECKLAQEAVRYAPNGTASCCRSLHSDGYNPAEFMNYMKWVEDPLFVPMIEDPEGVEHLDEIIDELKPGRDMLMFGKADYGMALGTMKPDGTYTEEVGIAYKEVMKRCKERGIGFMACPSASAKGQTSEDVQKVIDEGCSAVVLNTDQMTLMQAMKNIVGDCMNMKIQK